MANKILFLLLFILILLAGVYDKNNPEIIRINGCDYLKTYKGYGNIILKHSPNCKRKVHMSYSTVTYK
jgi:hypothetical protein